MRSTAWPGGSAGEEDTCAIRSNGTLACWGLNWYGEASPPSGTFVAVSAGTIHSCAIKKTDGTIVCWGSNTSGQATPPSGTFVAVGTGGYHTCAIAAAGKIVCWGSNDYGEGTAPK